MTIGIVTLSLLGILLLCPDLSATEAFAPHSLHHNNGFVKRRYWDATTTRLQSSTAAVIQEVATKPIPGMKPGTSGLRKKVEVWQGIDPSNRYYVENFIQSLLDTEASRNGGVIPKT